MFNDDKKVKQDFLDITLCSGAYQYSFFRAFGSFSDAKSNVKALVALPIINLFLALQRSLNFLSLTIFGVANIAIGAATFDLNELKRGGECLIGGAGELVSLIYFAVSIFTDTLETFARLVTHSLATVALGIALGIEAISECFSPSSTSQFSF